MSDKNDRNINLLSHYIDGIFFCFINVIQSVHRVTPPCAAIVVVETFPVMCSFYFSSVFWLVSVSLDLGYIATSWFGTWYHLTPCIYCHMWTRLFYNIFSVYQDFFLNRRFRIILFLLLLMFLNIHLRVDKAWDSGLFVKAANNSNLWFISCQWLTNSQHFLGGKCTKQVNCRQWWRCWALSPAGSGLWHNSLCEKRRILWRVVRETPPTGPAGPPQGLHTVPAKKKTKTKHTHTHTQKHYIKTNITHILNITAV